ncbi:hypothetical protein [Streptomyces sp. NPDC008121]|uniref:hypothetical protein n=1 Tax=Streptomyces sp. NPDC008121 TaxID=3364809 RepID=UPI0036E8854A
MAEAAGVFDECGAGVHDGEGVFFDGVEGDFRAHPVWAWLEQADGLDSLGARLGQPPQELGLAGGAAADDVGGPGFAQDVELAGQAPAAGAVGFDEPVELPR